MQAEARRRILSYRYQAEVPGAGTLLIRPMSTRWLDALADLLTDSFADSLGHVTAYKTFLRHSIAKYLAHHLTLPPKAVVLMALITPSTLPATTEGPACGTGSADVGSGGGGSGSDSDSGGGTRSNHISSSSFAIEQAASAANDASRVAPQQQLYSGPTAHGLEGCSRDSSSSSSSRLAQAILAAAAAASSHGQDDAADAELVAAGATLVGVVEVSFTASTRNKHLTLNPPPTSPYLCNMAVAEGSRGQGIGHHILQAAEQLSCVVCGSTQTQMFLHLR